MCPHSDDRLPGEEFLASAARKLKARFKEALDPEAFFFRAVKQGGLAEVRRMLDEGADPNIHNSGHRAALHVAAVDGLSRMIDLLIEKGANPLLGRSDDPKHVPLQDAISFGHESAALTLIRHGGYAVEKDADGWTLLHRACEKGMRHAARAMIDKGADPNARTSSGATPLIVALRRGQEDTALALLELHAVAAGMNTLYLESDADKRTAFDFAIEHGHARAVAAMVQKGVLVNLPDEHGITPLTNAIAHGHLNVVKALVQFGADINKTASGAELPLVTAKAAGKQEIVDYLIGQGAVDHMRSGVKNTTPPPRL